MAGKGPLPDLIIVLICFITAVLAAVLLQPVTGRWDAVLFVIVLFALLWGVATKRGWKIPVALPFVRSSIISEILLGLLATVIALAVSWLAGNALSNMYSDIVGIPAGLVLFGAIMIVVSSSRAWQ